MSYHEERIEQHIYIYKLLLKSGFKISPKKCQLFRKELQCMGKTKFIKDRRVCVKPL